MGVSLTSNDRRRRHTDQCPRRADITRECTCPPGWRWQFFTDEDLDALRRAANGEDDFDAAEMRRVISAELARRAGSTQR